MKKYCFISFLLFMMNYHKLSGLKQHPYISSQLSRSEVWHGVAGFSAQDSIKLEFSVLTGLSSLLSLISSKVDFRDPALLISLFLCVFYFMNLCS